MSKFIRNFTAAMCSLALFALIASLVIPQKAEANTPGCPTSPIVYALNYGMTADDSSDDSAGLSSAIAAALTQQLPLYIPAGTYLFGSETDISIPAGKSLTIFGAGDATVLKRADASVTADNQEVLYLSTTGTGTIPNIEISNMKFDGNARNNPFPVGTTDMYLWEHDAHLRIQGNTSAVIDNVNIHDITGYDPIADHVLFSGTTNSYVNNVTVSNFSGTYRNRTRSDVTVTGGVNTMLVKDSTFTRLEVELNSAFDEGDMDYTVQNTTLTDRLDLMGKLDASGHATLKYTGSDITANDINFTDLYGSMINSTVEMARTDLMTRVNGLQGFTFDNILFNITPISNAVSPLTFYPYDKNNITIQNSQFVLKDPNPLLAPTGYAIVLKARSNTSTHMNYTLKNNTFDSRLQSNIDINRADTVTLENNVYSSATGSHAVRVYSNTTAPLTLTLTGGDRTTNVKGTFVYYQNSAGLTLVDNP